MGSLLVHAFHSYHSLACSIACLTLVAWMSHCVFILCVLILPWARHFLGVSFFFFNPAHVSFHPLFVSWLLLLSCHCVVFAMISFNFFCWTSFGPVGRSTCHPNSLGYSSLSSIFFTA